MIHFFKKPVSHLALPEKFTYPFHYTPHPLCVLAAEEVKAYITEKFPEQLATKNKGMIMKAVMADMKGKADGELINQVVAELCK